MSLNPFSRLPNWLRDALGLRAQDLPANLATNAVCPVVDTFQRGYVYGQHFGDEFQQGAGALAFTEVIKEFNDDYNLVLMAMSVSHQGGAADATVNLDIITPDQQSITTIEVVSAPINATTPFQFNIRRPVWVPPNFLCRIQGSATAGGETYQVFWWEIRIRSGFVPTPF